MPGRAVMILAREKKARPGGLRRLRGVSHRPLVRAVSTGSGAVLLFLFGVVGIWAGIRAGSAGPILLGALLLLVWAGVVYTIARSQILAQLPVPEVAPELTTPDVEVTDE